MQPQTYTSGQGHKHQNLTHYSESSILKGANGKVIFPQLKGSAMETQTEFQAEMQRFDEQHVTDLMNKISDRLEIVRELDTECENYWLKQNRQLSLHCYLQMEEWVENMLGLSQYVAEITFRYPNQKFFDRAYRDSSDMVEQAEMLLSNWIGCF